MLAPAEFGAAVAIITVLVLARLVTDVALDRFVIVNSSPKALPVAHLLSAIRGVVVALALVIAAPGVAALFGIPDDAGSFVFTAALAAVGGFSHLGIKQIQSSYNYGPEGVSQLGASLASIAVLFPAINVLHDHRSDPRQPRQPRSVIYLVLSHALARTSYKMSHEKTVLREALTFGLPLTLNGIGLAIIYQLDRFMIGHWVGVVELAKYAVIQSLALVPTNLILGAFGN